jgi:hypothetical protein
MLSNSIYFFNNSTNTNILQHKLTREREKEKEEYKKQKLVHHIVSLHFFSLNEIEISKIIKQMHTDFHYSRRYYIFEIVQPIKIAELESALETLQPITIKRDIKNDDNLLLSFENRKLIYFDLNLKALRSSKKYIFQLIEFYRYLLRSIDLLVTAGIVHNNINFNTILVDSFDTPILTNFMHSINLHKFDTLSDSMASYMTHFLSREIKDQLQWPIEFCILKYQLTNKLESLSLYNIESIIRKYVDDHTILNTFGSDVVQNYLADGILYFNKYTNKRYQENIVDILKYSHTWDNYALSIVYLRILIGLHRVINVNNKFVILFMKLLVSNISLDPSKRPSLQNKRFEKMLNNIDLSDFQMLVSML